MPTQTTCIDCEHSYLLKRGQADSSASFDSGASTAWAAAKVTDWTSASASGYHNIFACNVENGQTGSQSGYVQIYYEVASDEIRCYVGEGWTTQDFLIRSGASSEWARYAVACAGGLSDPVVLHYIFEDQSSVTSVTVSDVGGNPNKGGQLRQYILGGANFGSDEESYGLRIAQGGVAKVAYSASDVLTQRASETPIYTGSNLMSWYDLSDWTGTPENDVGATYGAAGTFDLQEFDALEGATVNDYPGAWDAVAPATTEFVGSFDAEILPLAWFDAEVFPNGWFAPEILKVPGQPASINLSSVVASAVAASVATTAAIAMTPTGVARTAASVRSQAFAPSSTGVSPASFVPVTLTPAPEARSVGTFALASMTASAVARAALTVTPATLSASEVGRSGAAVHPATLTGTPESSSVTSVVPASLAPVAIGASTAPGAMVLGQLVGTETARSVAQVRAVALVTSVQAPSVASLATRSLTATETARSAAVAAMARLVANDVGRSPAAVRPVTQVPAEPARSVVTLRLAALSPSPVAPSSTYAIVSLGQLVAAEVARSVAALRGSSLTPTTVSGSAASVCAAVLGTVAIGASSVGVRGATFAPVQVAKSSLSVGLPPLTVATVGASGSAIAPASLAPTASQPSRAALFVGQLVPLEVGESELQELSFEVGLLVPSQVLPSAAVTMLTTLIPSTERPSYATFERAPAERRIATPARDRLASSERSSRRAKW